MKHTFFIKANASSEAALWKMRAWEHQTPKRLWKNTQCAISMLAEAFQMKLYEVTERLNRSYDQIILELQNVAEYPSHRPFNRSSDASQPPTIISRIRISWRRDNICFAFSTEIEHFFNKCDASRTLKIHTTIVISCIKFATARNDCCRAREYCVWHILLSHLHEFNPILYPLLCFFHSTHYIIHQLTDVSQHESCT